MTRSLRLLTALVLSLTMLAATGPAASALDLDVSLLGVDASVSTDLLDLDVTVSTEALSWEDGDTTASLDHVAEVVGADHLHDAGLTGEGIGVALIDTGVADVPGLQDVVRGPDLSLDAMDSEAYTEDLYGHGTHLAGIIASDRADAPGIAPDATLVSLKVGARNGAVDVSQAIAAIDWVVQHADEHNIRVLALAYGTDGEQDPALDPLAHAVQVAWRHGIVVVVAVGNHGEFRDPVVDPATDPYVIGVGAVDTQGTDAELDDEVPDFSAPGTPQRRPDVYAPGAGIVSLQTPGGYLDLTYPQARRDNGLFRGNGTSQSAAVVVGAAALLLQDRPELTPDQVKQLLVDSSGGDLLDLDRSIDVAVAAGLPVGPATQHHPVSTGTGSLELARGGTHLGEGEDALVGEVDIHGQPFDSAAWAAAAEAGTSWDEGLWNSTQWTGTGWNADGTVWNGWSWNGWSWNGWSWNGISWNGWSWNGWSWNGWSWNARDWS